ncbi:phosphohydrolase [Endozoicomonas sp. GU-1]|uniref:phosphohydrolase n=1 Tax=Endozoicomonas sp. GU-1 TaxID=3009078 RepID=UPI0022B396F2|nr:phosphohydrolase [Endozoicomonas sp. GU-1]WBA82159.1 phosphohydrolase [Endozoicomonas sp. GU-1]WBA85101.1 phosphohydrolase [Endozoicomonas sp. GU-1]
MSNSSSDILSSWEQKIIAWLQSMHHDHDDHSHDFSHFQRVWKTAQQIIDLEQVSVNPLVVLAACYFHDIVVLPKDHPERSRASSLAALKTRTCLEDMGFPAELIDNVCHSVASHSYSAGIAPETMEAKVVQDADRMEALGAIGLARVFYTSGLLRRKMFDPEDPLAEHRALDDREYALDHFQVKLLKLSDTMQTSAGRRMAERNSEYLREYMGKLLKELEGDYS